VECFLEYKQSYKKLRLNTKVAVMEAQIIVDLICQDQYRMQCLQAAAQHAKAESLDDWGLAAGFVRNKLWDWYFKIPTEDCAPLTDIDFIYFDAHRLSKAQDKGHEQSLNAVLNAPWSVKNQAYMHLRNDDQPYKSTLDAMSYWVEVETAICVSLDKNGVVILQSPFGFKSSLLGTVTINKKRPKPCTFLSRIKTKRWREHWPGLQVLDSVSLNALGPLN